MASKRGRKPVGEVAMSAAERMRRHREAKAGGAVQQELTEIEKLRRQVAELQAAKQPPLRNADGKASEPPEDTGADYMAAFEKLVSSVPKADQDRLLKGHRLLIKMYKAAMEAEYKKVNAERAQVDEERRKVRAKIDVHFAAEKARLDEALRKAHAEEQRYRERYNLVHSQIDSHMTRDDYKFLVGCVHPDKHPGLDKEGMQKWSKAFRILHQLEKWVDAKQPLDELRRKGWETISKRFKPKRS